jgi:WD40 repeat protein
VVLRGHEGQVTAVAISPDNHWLVTGSADKTAVCGLLQTGELIDPARATVGRDFSAYEWQLYFRQAISGEVSEFTGSVAKAMRALWLQRPLERI